MTESTAAEAERRRGHERARARVARSCSAHDARGEARADRRLLGEGGRRGRRAAAGRVRCDDARSRSSPGTGSATSPGPTAPARWTPPSAPRGCGTSSATWSRGTRLGIPAIVHEECLTGLSAWKAATFPTPLAWGATFDPELVAGDGRRDRRLDARRSASTRGSRRCSTSSATRAGAASRSASPRTRTSSAPSARRTCAGLQSQGVHATLKHFVGYSASQAGRNFAPVHAGRASSPTCCSSRSRWRSSTAARARSCTRTPRSTACRSPPTREPAHRPAARPVGLRRHRRRRLLRRRVPAPAAPRRGATTARPPARRWPPASTSSCRPATPTSARWRSGSAPAQVDEALVDRAVLRVLRQKEELGLLDATLRRRATHGRRPRLARAPGDLARRLAEESVVLVSNDGTLPLAEPRRVAVIGPNADRTQALFGCYSFVNHVLAQHPGVRGRTRGADRRRRPARRAAGAAAHRRARLRRRRRRPVRLRRRRRGRGRRASVAVLVVGDHAGLFGRGTVGEGCDRDDLELPGVQRELVEAVLATGTPVVLVLVTGRPYAVDWAIERCAAVRAGVLPRRGGRRGDRRRAVRAGQPVRARCR